MAASCPGPFFVARGKRFFPSFFFLQTHILWCFCNAALHLVGLCCRFSTHQVYGFSVTGGEGKPKIWAGRAWGLPPLTLAWGIFKTYLDLAYPYYRFTWQLLLFVSLKSFPPGKQHASANPPQPNPGLGGIPVCGWPVLLGGGFPS